MYIYFTMQKFLLNFAFSYLAYHWTKRNELLLLTIEHKWSLYFSKHLFYKIFSPENRVFEYVLKSVWILYVLPFLFSELQLFDKISTAISFSHLRRESINHLGFILRLLKLKCNIDLRLLRMSKNTKKRDHRPLSILINDCLFECKSPQET